MPETPNPAQTPATPNNPTTPTPKKEWKETAEELMQAVSVLACQAIDDGRIQAACLTVAVDFDPDHTQTRQYSDTVINPDDSPERQKEVQSKRKHLNYVLGTHFRDLYKKFVTFIVEDLRS